jgi:hypothetical protein
VRSKETCWLPLPLPLPLEMPEPTTSRVGAALVLAMALVMSAVAADPVTVAVLAGEALDAVVVPDVTLAAGELLELPEVLDAHAAVAVPSAAARMTVGTALPSLPGVNFVDTMSPPFNI